MISKRQSGFPCPLVALSENRPKRLGPNSKGLSFISPLQWSFRGNIYILYIYILCIYIYHSYIYTVVCNYTEVPKMGVPP